MIKELKKIIQKRKKKRKIHKIIDDTVRMANQYNIPYAREVRYGINISLRIDYHLQNIKKIFNRWELDINEYSKRNKKIRTKDSKIKKIN